MIYSYPQMNGIYVALSTRQYIETPHNIALKIYRLTNNTASIYFYGYYLPTLMRQIDEKKQIIGIFKR